jgi:hypothetical protein
MSILVVYPVTNTSPRVVINEARTREQAYGVWMDPITTYLFWANVLASFYFWGVLTARLTRGEDRAMSKIAVETPDTELGNLAEEYNPISSDAHDEKPDAELGNPADSKKEDTPKQLQAHEILVLVLAMFLVFFWPWNSMDFASSMAQQVSCNQVLVCTVSETMPNYRRYGIIDALTIPSKLHFKDSHIV